MSQVTANAAGAPPPTTSAAREEEASSLRSENALKVGLARGPWGEPRLCACTSSYIRLTTLPGVGRTIAGGRDTAGAEGDAPAAISPSGTVAGFAAAPISRPCR